jgi:hypothetical protein
MIFPCAMGLWSWGLWQAKTIPIAHEVLGNAASPNAITMTAPTSRKCGAREYCKQWNLHCSDGSRVACPYIHRVAEVWHMLKLSS